MKKSLALAAVVALVAAAFWLGRKTDDVRADAPVPAPTTRVEPRASVPRLPALPTRAVARGLAADLVAADPKIRRAAVAEAGDPRVLLTASRDPDGDVARTAILSLTKLYVDGQVEPKEIIAVATDRTIPDRTRLFAINGVAGVASPEGAAMLVQMLGGTTLERRAASVSLAGQDPEVAVPALITALSDGDEYVRLQAVDSLKLLSRGRDFGLDAGAWRAWWQARR